MKGRTEMFIQRILLLIAFGLGVADQARGDQQTAADRAYSAESSDKEVRSFTVSFRWNKGVSDVEIQSEEAQSQPIPSDIRSAVLDEARKAIPNLFHTNQLERAYGTIHCQAKRANGALTASCLSSLYKVYDPDGETPIMKAAKRADYEAFRKALAEGAAVNSKDQSGSSALMYAVYGGNPKIVKDLLNAGADPNWSSRKAWTALLLAAATHDRLEILRELIHAHAYVDAKEEDGRTALFIAASHDMVDVMKMLIDAGADVNARANNGETPLIVAAGRGHVDAVKLLLAARADLQARDKDGGDALAAARAKVNQEIVSLLEEAKEKM